MCTEHESAPIKFSEHKWIRRIVRLKTPFIEIGLRQTQMLKNGLKTILPDDIIAIYVTCTALLGTKLHKNVTIKISFFSIISVVIDFNFHFEK